MRHALPSHYRQGVTIAVPQLSNPQPPPSCCAFTGRRSRVLPRHEPRHDSTWAAHKVLLPLHYSVYVTEVGCKKSAVANVESMSSQTLASSPRRYKASRQRHHMCPAR
jgi:hypothetical protein